MIDGKVWSFTRGDLKFFLHARSLGKTDGDGDLARIGQSSKTTPRAVANGSRPVILATAWTTEDYRRCFTTMLANKQFAEAH